MKNSIIVWAPQGSGLGDEMANKLKRHFGLNNIVDELDGGHTQPQLNHLIIARCSQAPRSPLRVIAFANALLQMTGAQK